MQVVLRPRGKVLPEVHEAKDKGRPRAQCHEQIHPCSTCS